MNTLIIGGIVLAVVLVFLYVQPSDVFSIKDGKIYYPINRLPPKFNTLTVENNANYSLTKIAFENRNTTVYALLRIQKNVLKPPVAIILPGATVPKEARQNLAEMLEKQGWASLALDLRGNGETKATPTTTDAEYRRFLQGKEILEAEMTLDVLKAYDVLSAFPVNRQKTVLIGESMGGRYALMAAGIDSSIKGVIVISSSGYGLPRANDAKQTEFFRAIDPDNYLEKINAPILFIHSQTDQVIPFNYAQRSYTYANSPKEFFEVSCPHGYCPAMDDKITEFLKKK